MVWLQSDPLCAVVCGLLEVGVGSWWWAWSLAAVSCCQARAAAALFTIYGPRCCLVTVLSEHVASALLLLHWFLVPPVRTSFTSTSKWSQCRSNTGWWWFVICDLQLCQSKMGKNFRFYVLFGLNIADTIALTVVVMWEKLPAVEISLLGGDSHSCKLKCRYLLILKVTGLPHALSKWKDCISFCLQNFHFKQ